MATERATTTQPQAGRRAVTGAYVLEGTMLEACNCQVLCPCCAGESPDAGTCDSIFAYHIDRGQINQVDVSGLNMVAVIHSPGKMFEGHWRRGLVVDQQATHEQSVALTDAFDGRLGGPLADLAALVSERQEVAWAPIGYGDSEGASTVTVGDQVTAALTPLTSVAGEPITISHSMLGASVGEPARAARSSSVQVNLETPRTVWSFTGRHASQSRFRFEA